MKLYISAEAKIKEIANIFQERFPYLKLVFFKSKHGLLEGSSRKDIIPSNSTLIEAAGAMKEGELEIKPQQTVAEVEQAFQKKFNLPVQIFRKARFSWIETTMTDQLTLARQNSMGRAACGAIYDEEVLL